MLGFNTLSQLSFAGQLYQGFLNKVFSWRPWLYWMLAAASTSQKIHFDWPSIFQEAFPESKQS